MALKLFAAFLLPAAFAAGSVWAADHDGFRSLGDIEAALDPLEIIADYDGVRVSIDLTIAFAFDSDELLPEAQPQIEALGTALSGERLGVYRFKLIGHTDGVGGAAYNQRLSERRAARVKQALVKDYGVQPDRLIAEGKGFSQPKPGLPPDAAQHRRVEVQTVREAPDSSPDEQATDELGGIKVDG